MTRAPATAVRLDGIDKRFGSTVALDGADLALRVREVHGVLGENGAGKTTLFRVLGGLLRPDAGRIFLAAPDAACARDAGDSEGTGRPRGADAPGAPSEREIELAGPRDAWRYGIGLVHQHFTLVPRLTVLENLALGVRRRGGFALPLAEVRERADALRARTGLEVPFEPAVETLGVGVRQRVEILKVLLREPEVLILDEPTAVLTPGEVERLLELLRALAADGRAVAMVAHKLDEVLAVADRITVLRAGRTVLASPRAEVTAESLARAMVGAEAARDAADSVALMAHEVREAAEVPSDGGEVVARLSGVGVVEGGEGGRPRLEDVDLVVRRGEIVGIAGVEGNGQRELARVLAGRAIPDRGRAEIPADPGFIPQDRRHEGLALDFDLVENLALALHRDGAFRRGPLLRWPAIRERARGAVDRYGIRTPSIETPARSLSGGNQQRVVVARELERGGGLLVAENPTRGLDVAGEAYVHRQLRELVRRERPPGIVLISTDLDEVLLLATRVLVMVRGRLTPVPEGERSREAIGARMLAGEPARSAAGSVPAEPPGGGSGSVESSG